jgi:hypothetical protein
MISLTTPAMGCLFRSIFYLTQTYDSYSYELEELTSSNDEYKIWFQFVLGYAIRISYMITHD